MADANNPWLEKALSNAERIRNGITSVLRRWLEFIQQMPGAKRLFERIARVSAKDPEQLDDYLAEAECILVFAGLGFQVEIEPLGSKGPDLKVSRNGRSAIVEVHRMRKVYPGPVLSPPGEKVPLLQSYGNPGRDIRKSFEKLLEKFSQVGQHDSIIAIWNDDGDLEELEVESAVRDLRDDVSHGIFSLPSGLSFVLYRSKWLHYRNQNSQQMFCFPLKNDDENRFRDWMKELERFTVNQLVQTALSR